MKSKQRGFIGPILSGLGGMLDMLPGIIWAGLVVLLLVSSCADRSTLLTEKTNHATTKTNFKAYEAAVERRENVRGQAALAEGERQREIERVRNKQAVEADNATRNELQTTRAALAARTAARVFDKAVDVFAAAGPAGGQAGGDPRAVRHAEEKTATLGQLLKTCRAEGASDAGELEDLASQVRGLQASYLSLSSASAGPSPPSGGSPAD